jgi:hypothetical protein
MCILRVNTTNFFHGKNPLNQLNPYLSTAKTSANCGEDFHPAGQSGDDLQASG